MPLSYVYRHTRSERGSTLVEATLVVALIAVVCAMGVAGMSKDLKRSYCQTALAMDGGTSGSGLPPNGDPPLQFICGDDSNEGADDD